MLTNLAPCLNPIRPDVLAKNPFCGLNLRPEGLPGFSENVPVYCNAMEKLGKSLMSLYALRISHCPQTDPSSDERGLAPHTDISFMTVLAQNKVPGLSIRLPNGRDMMRRWTNERVLATPNRVINRSGLWRLRNLLLRMQLRLPLGLPADLPGPRTAAALRPYQLSRVHVMVPQRQLWRARRQGRRATCSLNGAHRHGLPR